MSSLVLSSDRRGRQVEEDKGVQSLAGRIDPKSMGTRAFREKVDAGKAKEKAAAREGKRRDENLQNGAPAAKRARAGNAMGARDIISAADLMEGMEYIPRTAETRETYELILSAVHDAMGGEQPQDVIRDATDFVIVTLKDENLKDFDKKKEISSAIPGLSTETFTTLVNLGKKITDFGADEADGAKDPDQDKNDGRIDDDVGVAVVFEDEEEDEDRIGDEDEDENAAFEVRDESDDEDIINAQIGGEDATNGNNTNGAGVDDDEDQEIIIGNETGASTSANGKKQSDIIPARDIDGFWLQRLISQSYPDPHETAEKTTSAMALLSADSSLRDCENSLMELFDYENFELVKVLLKNREKIVWCTKLARSDDNQRMDVEVAMREKGVGWILKELANAEAAAVAAQQAANGGDVDMAPPAEVASIPKANIQAGSLVQPKGTVDLDSMMFGQGARLMSNKKCRLPEGSFKRSKKGYEEIHIPPPEKKAAKPGEELPIEELPEWTRAAFGKAKSLNRVQTKVYPVAFGEDDPILLCAPTGAGKVRLDSICLLVTFNRG